MFTKTSGEPGPSPPLGDHRPPSPMGWLVPEEDKWRVRSFITTQSNKNTHLCDAAGNHMGNSNEALLLPLPAREIPLRLLGNWKSYPHPVMKLFIDSPHTPVAVEANSRTGLLSLSGSSVKPPFTAGVGEDSK